MSYATFSAPLGIDARQNKFFKSFIVQGVGFPGPTGGYQANSIADASTDANLLRVEGVVTSGMQPAVIKIYDNGDVID